MDETQTAPEAEIPSDAVVPETQEVQDTAPAAEENEERKRERGVERRINRLARERAEARGEADFLRAQLQSQQNQYRQDDQDVPLTRAELDAEFARRHAQQFEADRQNRISGKLQGAIKADKEFADALSSADVEFKPQQLAILRETLDESDQAVELMRYLAKNPDEADRLAEFSPTKFARELGRLEDKVAALAKPQRSAAPKPLEAVRANASPGAPKPEDTEAWIAWRNKSLKK